MSAEVIEQSANPDRSTFLGGSDIAAILSLSPWKTRLQTYLEKVGGYVEEITPQRQAIFDRGHRMEAYVREWARQDFGLEIQAANARYTHPQYPFLSCEIDFEWMDEGNVPANADVKTVHWRSAHHWGEPGTDEVPLYYTSQFIFGQAVTGRDMTLCVAMLGLDDLRPYRVRHDAELANHIVQRAVAFWEQHVIKRVPPEPQNLDDVQLLYARDTGRPIEASVEIAEIIAHLKQEKAAVADHKSRQEALELEVKMFIGEHTDLVDSAGRKLASWKIQSKKSYTVKASECRVFRLHGGE